MTLLTTEIHPRGSHVIVFAADRRISLADAPHDSRPKVFQIASGRAGIGYFGLAGVPTPAGYQPMALWLERFISGIPPTTPLRDTARILSDELNRAVPASLRASQVSGLHLAGFAVGGIPEFWFVRNVDDTGSPTLGKYEAREDFQRRDAAGLKAGQVAIYRNGDIRPHVAIWNRVDEGFGLLLSEPDFRGLQNLDDYVAWVKFKMELIGQFYDRYCKRSIIGSPIDAFYLVGGGAADA